MGRLTYQRLIPLALRPYVGNKATIRRSLGVDSTDCSSPQVLTAYALVHGQMQGVIDAAEAQHLQKSTAIQVQPQSFALSPRDVAGIAANPLLEMRNALADGRITTPIQAELQKVAPDFLAQVAWAFMTGDASQIQGAFGQMTQPLLDQLGISANETDMSAITQRLLGYGADARADVEKLQANDWSPPALAAKAPPIPKRKLSWQQMLEAWQLSTGGVLEVDGYGVSRMRIKIYEGAIKDFMTHISDVSPEELTIEDARRFINWLQKDSGISHGTQINKLICLKNLFKIAVKAQQLEVNPFESFTLKQPAGSADVKGYETFTQAELIEIFSEVQKERLLHYRIIPYILLMTGCRMGEAIQLRTTDIQQTKAGCWFIDWRHEPTAEYPMLLKSKTSNNRMMPIHQVLIDQGLLAIDRSTSGRLFKDAPQVVTTHSSHFKELLIRLDVWVKKKKVGHSLRNNARDLWREAGIPRDVRDSFTGHATVGAGEKYYGEGLASMPDKLNQYLQQIDISWLP